MKKRIIFLFIICLFINCYAENNYYYLSLYKHYGKEKTYTEEFLFYDDGLIKQINYYDLQEKCDYYNWKNVKKELKLVNQYNVIRENNKIEVFFNNNHSDVLVQTIININDNIWNVKNNTTYNTTEYEINLDDNKYLISNEKIITPTTEAYLVDNILYSLTDKYIDINKQVRKQELKIDFDDKNVYKITTNHPYGEDCYTINYISEYIPFSKNTALLNKCITNKNNLNLVFFTVPTVPKKSNENINEKDS